MTIGRLTGTRSASWPAGSRLTAPSRISRMPAGNIDLTKDRNVSGETRPDGRPQVTHAMEDYLKAVYRLEETDGQVTTQRLSDELWGDGPASTKNNQRP